MVMQPTADFMVGGSNPGLARMAAAPRIRTADLKIYSRLCDCLTTGSCYSHVPPHCLEPSERKLLTPPHTPTPPLKKMTSSFRG